MIIYQPKFGYVYKITNIKTEKYYFGSRTATISKRIEPEKDLWIKYFTSSVEIKNQIEQYGKDAFIFEILFRDNDGDTVFWEEQKFIKDHIDFEKCLNKHYFDKASGHEIFSTFGKQPWNKGKPSPNRGVPRPEKTVILMSHNRKGKNKGQIPWNKGKTGVYSEETLNAMKSGASFRNRGEKNPFYGKNHDNEFLDKMSKKQSEIVVCPHCGTSGARFPMLRWHFNRCKKK